jgi:error-prone DNA polymerase
MGFAHLHVHSVWSLLAGVPSVDQLVARAKELGFTSLALTDTNRTSGLILFYQACLRAGLKPILGLELSEELAPLENLVALARNAKGYGDLCELSSLRMLHPKDFRFGKAMERAWPDLIFLTNHPRCLEALIRSPNRPMTFGELINHDQASRERSRTIERLCTAEGIPLVAAHDAYFLEPGEWELHRMLRAIDLNSTLSRLRPDEAASPKAWLYGEARMRELFPSHPEALKNTERIAEGCAVKLELGKWIMPEIGVPAGHSPDSYLAELSRQGLWRNYANTQDYEKASTIQELELKTISKLGYSSYFLMVKEIRDWANNRFKTRYRQPRDATILRGSAANSLTFYNLEVSDLDPIKYDLYFQRFLNEDRASPPDADLDFGWDEREEVLDHVVERFGRDRVAITCTTNHFRSRAAFREVAKVFGFSENQVSEVLTSFETRANRLDDDAIREILGWAKRIKGRPRFFGQHPGGVLITNEPIWRRVGCEWSGGLKNRLITQTDMHNGIDELGLIKFDLLGNGSLSVFRDTLAQLEEQGLPDPGISKPHNLAKCFEDPMVQEIMGKGRTRGIFYIESPAQTRLNKKAQATTFEEITVTSSLVRPAGSAYTQTFVERHRKMKNGLVDWEFLHPSLKPILEETHDICAYQEDVTKICHHVAGLSFKKADRIRKMMNSQHEGMLAEEELLRVSMEFIEGCKVTSGLSDAQALELWTRVSSFTGFSFCKSHSASYAQLSFQCTYLKSRYPAQFLAAVISNNHGFYTRDVYIDEARRWGISILPIDINVSTVKYFGRGNWMRPGLLHVRSLPDAAKHAIVRERERKGPFHHLVDFLSRVDIGKTDVERLILVGAFDGFGLSQPELLFLLQSEYGKVRNDLPSLFGSAREYDSRAWHPGLGEYTLAQRCFNELHHLGYMLSGNLLSILELHPAARDAVPAAEIGKHAGRHVKVFGSTITDRMHWVQNTGRPMKFLTLQDHTECVDVIFWPNVLDKYEDLLQEPGPFEIWGKVTEDWDTYSLEATRVRRVAWSPNLVDFQRASEKLRASQKSWKPYADLPPIRAA